LDFNVTNNISLRVGANYFYLDAPNYNRGASLLAPDGFSRTNSQTGRGYVRFTQKFGNKTNVNEAKDNTITNAFYTVQVDYSKDYSTSQDKDKKHNTFDYGYIGKFKENYNPVYQAGGIDDSTGKAGIKLVGYTASGVDFTPGSQNTGMANYTKDMYSFLYPLDQNQILGARGLRNGDNPPAVYALFSNVGDNANGWSKNNTDQVAFQVDASFDIKHKRTTHSVEFGLYYQQRNTRSYNVNGSYLWTLMRQITTRVVSQEVDSRYATFIVDGKSYTWEQVKAGEISPGPNDTILYARKFDTSAQTAFDQHMREKVYGNRYANEYINTDNYDPSFYSIDMFSADDLFNGGQNRRVNTFGYYGYDYTGKATTGTVNFNDFWTAKDKDGYYTRPIGAYRPNYMAGYVSDYIQYKDFRITLGARVERFDNNTKVLKDPYSFYATKSAGEVGNHPANIGNDYVVYVGNNQVQNSAVIGYRDGDTWFDAQGREVADPRVLQTATGAQNVQPMLQNPTSRMTDANYDPNQSFTDYKPVVNVMPRINFSFPLNENALFYAHYDVMYQRPNVGSFATQIDYMFVEQNPDLTYGNSNLKPERAIDYEVGFQQRLTDNSGLTLSGFYKERKDQIQVRRYVYAFPITYLTYGNRDYSTYKGLSVNYDLRRVGNLSMNVNYTLSFTEGTGSNASSGVNSLAQLVAAGLPNLRTQFPVDYDSRHNINAQLDYRFRQGGGPVIGNSHILENFGVNLVFRARSGEPYTKYATPQNLQSGASNSPVIDGTVNGSRKGSHYNFDLNVDKTIPLNMKKSKESGKPSYLSLNIYAYAKNLLNYRDIVNVYGYTGRPDDDGFLASPQGQTVISAQVDPASFTSYYNLAMLSPYNYGAPRTILVGLRLNF
jgi:outer membrane receptor protein involved in Fe transport